MLISDLEARIACFREILHANNAALGFLADIQEGIESTDHLSASDISKMVTGATVQTFRMISNLIRLSGDRKYRALLKLFDALKTKIANNIQLTPALKSVAPLVIPLTLGDHHSSGYSLQKCKTIHDIIRFCHQATIEAMFDLGDKSLRRSHLPRRLVSQVPIDCRILDLGGGIKQNGKGNKVVLEEIVCRPMLALWRGMTDSRLHWGETRSISLRRFISAIVDYSFDLDARLRPMGEPSYVFITADYMNFNSRIGYHFATVDARVCDVIESNHAYFRFVGGSTGIEQRSRRALLIEQLLEIKGFETDRLADLVNARIQYRPPEEMEEALFEVGLLIGYVNHLDMSLVSDEVMLDYRNAFLAGNYEYKN